MKPTFYDQLELRYGLTEVNLTMVVNTMGYNRVVVLVHIG